MILTEYLNACMPYSVSVSTASRELGIPAPDILLLAKQESINVFMYAGVLYIGTEENKKAYYQDKLLGQNPFYQTY